MTKSPSVKTIKQLDKEFVDWASQFVDMKPTKLKGGGQATLRIGKAEAPTNIFNKEDCPCVCHEDDWKKCFNCKNNHKEDGT